MFSTLLGRLSNEYWLTVLVAWLLLAGGLKLVAPSWDQVALDGDLDYLPVDSPSIRATRLLNEAFPNEKTKSQVVLIFDRDGEPLTVEDRQFALDLSKRLEQFDDLPLVDVWNAKTEVVHRMLLAPDESAQLVVARLSNPLMATDNIRVRDRVLNLVDQMSPETPAGLQIGVTGSAIIGGDIRFAIYTSLSNTHKATLALVLLCLVAIYRAPLLVLVPLATIALSMSVSYDVVALLADHFGPGDYPWSNLKIFTTTKIFVVVILFGAGTDYCLFLIARYKEELGQGVSPAQAPGQALGKVSGALAGSAFTTILGLGTMVFAQYGKFANSGPVIAACLFIALGASVTFAPALLRALGPAVFWPFSARVQKEPHTDMEHDASRFWVGLGSIVLKRPATILFVSLLAAAPLIYSGASVRVNHDLLAELPPESASVAGAQRVGRRFGQGWVAPLSILAEVADADFHESDSRFDIALLHDAVFRLEGVQDVRSLYLPTGGDPSKQKRLSAVAIQDLAAAGSPLTVGTFVSNAKPHKGQVTRLSVVLAADPFSVAGRDLIPTIRQTLNEIGLADQLHGEPNPWRGARFELAGTTPGIRDLQLVTAKDQSRIQICTVLAVLAVLLLLLKRPLACCYLIVTVLVSYWVTIGITELFFSWLYGASFVGLDWKVPIFLFVILVAIGQDYNIYLTTRVFEEQAKLGRRKGLERAIVQTGGIITSCGIIMAGTFISMTTGSMRGMVELGFALSLGVLLDTFLVRTIIVPCYFALIARWCGDDAAEPTALSLSKKDADLASS